MKHQLHWIQDEDGDFWVEFPDGRWFCLDEYPWGHESSGRKDVESFGVRAEGVVGA